MLLRLPGNGRKTPMIFNKRWSASCRPTLHCASLNWMSLHSENSAVAEATTRLRLRKMRRGTANWKNRQREAKKALFQSFESYTRVRRHLQHANWVPKGSDKNSESTLQFSTRVNWKGIRKSIRVWFNREGGYNSLRQSLLETIFEHFVHITDSTNFYPYVGSLMWFETLKQPKEKNT